MPYEPSYLAIAIYSFIAITYVVLTSLLQFKKVRKLKWIYSLIIPLVTSVLIFVLINSISLFWILTFFDFAYYLLIYFFSNLKIETRANKQKKIDIKDL